MKRNENKFMTPQGLADYEPNSTLHFTDQQTGIAYSLPGLNMLLQSSHADGLRVFGKLETQFTTGSLNSAIKDFHLHGPPPTMSADDFAPIRVALKKIEFDDFDLESVLFMDPAYIMQRFLPAVPWRFQPEFKNHDDSGITVGDRLYLNLNVSADKPAFWSLETTPNQFRHFLGSVIIRERLGQYLGTPTVSLSLNPDLQKGFLNWSSKGRAVYPTIFRSLDAENKRRRL